MALELSLLVDLGLIVIAATAFNFLARLLKQPALLAYIVAGVFLGPAVLGALNISIFGIPLGVTNLAEIQLLSELGVAFLLFSIGIELDLSKLKSIGKTVAIAGLLQVAFTTTITLALTSWLGLLTLPHAFVLGLVLSFSSTMVVIKLLSDSNKIDTLHGRLLVGILIVQDILAVILMPFVTNFSLFSSSDQFLQIVLSGVILVVTALGLSKFVYPIIYRFSIQSKELLFLMALSSAFVFIFLAEFVLNLPMAIGAFMAGMALSNLPYTSEIYESIKGFRDFLVTIFFTTLGLQLTFGTVLSTSFLTLFFLSLAIIYLAKLLVHYFVILFSGYGKQLSFNVALSLSQISEFSFILASQALLVGLISSELFSLSIVLLGFTLVATPYFFKYNLKIYNLFSHFLFPLKRQALPAFERKVSKLEEVLPVKNHVVIVGAGLFGSQIIEQLAKDNSVLVIDQNPEVIGSLMSQKINAVYGLVENPALWDKLQLQNTKLLVLALPDVKSALLMIKHAKKVNPDLTVFGRAHYYTEALALYNAGVSFVCMPQVLGSNALLQRIVAFLDPSTAYSIPSTWGKLENLQMIKEEAYKEKQLHIDALKDLEKEVKL